MGPAEIVFPALEEFWHEVEVECLLKLERSKTEVFTWSDRLPESTPPGLALAGSTVGGQFLPGFMCYGIPIGTDNYVRFKLQEKAKEIAADAEKTVRLLSGDKQALWNMLSRPGPHT